MRKIEDMRAPFLSVLIVDDDAVRAELIEAGLREAGHEKIAVVAQVKGIAGRIAEIEPDVIVIGLEQPSSDSLDSVLQLSRAVKRPIAMFVDRSDRDSMEAAINAGVSAYVVDGLKRERVKPILEMAVSRFNAYSRLERELADARSALQSRKMIERAKGLLMSTRGLTEDAAYTLLRKTAMNQNRRIADIAESLLISAEMLGRNDGG
jgi:response regulator NasT